MNRITLFAAALTFTAWAPCAAQPLSPKAEAQSYLNPCDGSDPNCEAEAAAFIRDYQRAMRGDYQAQRNVAFVLSGADRRVPVAANPVQGCAWRTVIVTAGHPEANAADAANLKSECARLTPAETLAVSGRAAELLDRIKASRAAR